MSLTELMHHHHKFCDDQFAEAEAAVSAGDWRGGGVLLENFRANLEAHFGTEEEVLFPAFESATGMTGGPTQMMRFEHAQMRDLLDRMRSAVQVKDASSFAGAAETLLILMQQHNMKEENILYPMCDQALGAQGAQLAGEITARLDKS